jgi:hypothetical protein
LRENIYKEAREKGVIFIRFDLENKPKVTQAADGSLTVTVPKFRSISTPTSPMSRDSWGTL